MKITDVAAIALVWPAPEREGWTALPPVGRVSELPARVHTDAGFYGIGEEVFTVRPEIIASTLTLNDRPGRGLELDELTLYRQGVWA